MHCLRKIVISSVSLLVTSTSCGSSATFSARRRITNDSMYLPLPVAGLMPAREEKKQQGPASSSAGLPESGRYKRRRASRPRPMTSTAQPRGKSAGSGAVSGATARSRTRRRTLAAILSLANSRLEALSRSASDSVLPDVPPRPSARHFEWECQNRRTRKWPHGFWSARRRARWCSARTEAGILSNRNRRRVRPTGACR